MPCRAVPLQTAKVHVYRLITKKTYEAEMFRRASRKLGLAQAVRLLVFCLRDPCLWLRRHAVTSCPQVFETGGIRRSFTETEEPSTGGLASLLKLDKDKVRATPTPVCTLVLFADRRGCCRALQVEMLLRFGAYAIMDDDSGAAEQFCAADIDKILGQAKTVVYDKVGGKEVRRVCGWQCRSFLRWCQRVGVCSSFVGVRRRARVKAQAAAHHLLLLLVRAVRRRERQRCRLQRRRLRRRDRTRRSTSTTRRSGRRCSALSPRSACSAT